MNCDSEKCFAVENYKLWKVSEYGSIIGADRMKSEIYERGPIACGMDSTDEFGEYQGGIYSEFKAIPIINHFVSIIGWGTENGVEYWIGRNSRGTYWGEQGYFRIEMHKDNLGIELMCSWAIPIID